MYAFIQEHVSCVQYVSGTELDVQLRIRQTWSLSSCSFYFCAVITIPAGIPLWNPTWA